MRQFLTKRWPKYGDTSEAIIREMEIRTLIADGANINRDGIDLDALEAEERELKGKLDELGRGDEWEKIRLEACRRFP